jgi:hypothetical protein
VNGLLERIKNLNHEMALLFFIRTLVNENTHLFLGDENCGVNLMGSAHWAAWLKHNPLPSKMN